MSPEMCEGKPYDTKSDVWALGCLMFELAALKPPFQAPNQALLARKIINEAPEAHVPSHYSREIPFIINKLLDKDPRKRPSPDSILNYSAVQIRLERARFQAREAELLAQLDEEKRQQARRAIEHTSALQRALQQQQQDDDSLHSELLMERAKVREARLQEEDRERARGQEREEWRKREAVLLQKCSFLESEVERERREKEAALHQLHQSRKYGGPAGQAPSHCRHSSTGEIECEFPTETEASPVPCTARTSADASAETPGPGTRESRAQKEEEQKEEESTTEPSNSKLDCLKLDCDVPMPTPNHLFVSPKGPSSRNASYTRGALTPSRDMHASVDMSAERATPVWR